MLDKTLIGITGLDDTADGGWPRSRATLTDAYTAGGDVLMGTLRWEKERHEEIARSEREIDARRAERASLAHARAAVRKESRLDRRRLGELRGADA